MIVATYEESIKKRKKKIFKARFLGFVVFIIFYYLFGFIFYVTSNINKVDNKVSFYNHLIPIVSTVNLSYKALMSNASLETILIPKNIGFIKSLDYDVYTVDMLNYEKKSQHFLDNQKALKEIKHKKSSDVIELNVKGVIPLIELNNKYIKEYQQLFDKKEIKEYIQSTNVSNKEKEDFIGKQTKTLKEKYDNEKKDLIKSYRGVKQIPILRIFFLVLFRILAYASGIFVMILLLFKKDKDLTTHGSQRWAILDDMTITKDSARPFSTDILVEKGVILGKMDGHILRDSAKTHILISAPTRTGKGVSIIIPTLVDTWDGSMCVLDIKGENHRQSSGYRKAMFDNSIINFAPLSNESSSYNPLNEVDYAFNGGNGESAEISKIIETLSASDKEEAGDFWKLSGDEFAQAMTFFAIYRKRYEDNCRIEAYKIKHNIGNNENKTVESLESDNDTPIIAKVEEEATNVENVITDDSKVEEIKQKGITEITQVKSLSGNKNIENKNVLQKDTPKQNAFEIPQTLLDNASSIASFGDVMDWITNPKNTDQMPLYLRKLSGQLPKGAIDKDGTPIIEKQACGFTDIKNPVYIYDDEKYNIELDNFYYHFDPRPNKDLDLKSKLKLIYPSDTALIDKGFHPLISRLLGKLGNNPNETLQGIIGNGSKIFTVFSDPIVRKNTSKSDFRIMSLMNGENPTTLYLVSEPKDLEKTGGILRLLLAQMVGILTPPMKTNDSPHSHKMLMMLDEFPAVGKLSILEKGIGFVAGWDMKIVIIVQSLSQLYNIYTKDNMLTPNCQVQVFYTANDNDTAQYISEFTGDETIVYDTLSGKKIFGGGSKGESYQSRKLLDVATVRNLDLEKIIVKVAGNPTALTEKIQYFKDPIFAPRTKLEPILTEGKDTKIVVDGNLLVIQNNKKYSKLKGFYGDKDGKVLTEYDKLERYVPYITDHDVETGLYGSMLQILLKLVYKDWSFFDEIYAKKISSEQIVKKGKLFNGYNVDVDTGIKTPIEKDVELKGIRLEYEIISKKEYEDNLKKPIEQRENYYLFRPLELAKIYYNIFERLIKNKKNVSIVAPNGKNISYVYGGNPKAISKTKTVKYASILNKDKVKKIENEINSLKETIKNSNDEKEISIIKSNIKKLEKELNYKVATVHTFGDGNINNSEIGTNSQGISMESPLIRVDNEDVIYNLNDFDIEFDIKFNEWEGKRDRFDKEKKPLPTVLYEYHIKGLKVPLEILFNKHYIDTQNNIFYGYLYGSNPQEFNKAPNGEDLELLQSFLFNYRNKNWSKLKDNIYHSQELQKQDWLKLLEDKTMITEKSNYKKVKAFLRKEFMRSINAIKNLGYKAKSKVKQIRKK